MTVREFRLPDPGEGLTEAEIVTWRVAVGDLVDVNDIVVEVETAKSLVELPIPYAGRVAALLVAEGDTVDVGTVIITVADGAAESVGAAQAASSPAPNPSAAPDAPAEVAAATPSVATQAVAAPAAAAPSVAAPAAAAPSVATQAVAAEVKRTPVLVGYGVKHTEAVRRPRRKEALKATIAHYPDEEEHVDPQGMAARSGELVAAHSTHVLRDRRPLTELAEAALEARPGVHVLAKPPLRKLAKDLGVDLARIVGSGPAGAITRADVESAAHPNEPGAATIAAPGTGSGGPVAGSTAAADPAREERVTIKGVRKITAAAMVASAFTAPHVTEWVTLDVTATMELLERLRADREFAGVKVTPLLVLAKAMCVAVRRNPGVNATWDEAAQEIVLKRYVNLGIAAATPRGLLVPNVKDADRLTMRELAEAIGALTETAREGKTSPADMTGGTVTVTNIGVFGIDSGTPIINPGESAIVALGAIARRPWVVDGGGPHERIEPRWVTTLAMSFDHRLVDGELGSRFLADLAALLADPARGLVWG